MTSKKAEAISIAHMITTADCVRIFRSLNRLITAVPLSPDGLDQRRILWILFNLKAQITNVYHDRVVSSTIVRFVPHRLVEALCGEDLAAVFHQEEKHSIFRIRQYKRTAVGDNLFLRFVDRKMVEEQRLF